MMIGVGISPCMVHATPRAPWLTRMLATTPEALWVPGADTTLSSGRASLLPDQTANGHDLAQAAAGNRPLYVDGTNPCLRFARARPDVLGGAIVDVGTGPYTIVSVHKHNTLPGAGEYHTLVHNGALYTDGCAIIVEPPSPALTPVKVYQWPATTVSAEPDPPTTLAARIWRATGTQLLARVAGVDAAPSALAAQLQPTSGCFVGAWNAAGGGPLDADLYLLAIYTRSLSAPDLATVAALLTERFAVAA
jgi:hypothetical protein